MAFEFKFPDVGEGIHEGELVKWLVKEGDTVKEDQPIAEVETDKAIVEIPSPRTGTILKLNYKEGDTLHVGDVIAVIGEAGEQAPAASKPAAAPQATKPTMASPAAIGASGMVLATPHTRQLARDIGVDIAQVRGTGPGGRITDDDVKAAAGKPAATPAAQPLGAATARQGASAGPKVSFEKHGRIIRVPLKGVRKATADHMVEAWRSVVPVTHMDEADITELAKVREKLKPVADNKGIKLTYLAFIMKACLAALKQHRYVNASIDDEKQEIVLKQYYNIGVAVDTPDGLMVPVLKGADQYSIMDLALHLQTVAEHARARELTVDDFKGSSFSITNIGSIGGTHFTPIINHPDGAILGVGRMQERLGKEGEAIVTRRILPLSLTFDHRLIDGALAAQFMNTIIKHLEDPDLLLVDA
jgi:pyruvate dehydrogenase E2 component (dihydrolipoamide acetyltransferase)